MSNNNSSDWFDHVDQMALIVVSLVIAGGVLFLAGHVIWWAIR